MLAELLADLWCKCACVCARGKMEKQRNCACRLVLAYMKNLWLEVEVWNIGAASLEQNTCCVCVCVCARVLRDQHE